MTPEEFRRAGHELIDWIADYRERVARAEFPVMARTTPGAIACGIAGGATAGSRRVRRDSPRPRRADPAGVHALAGSALSRLLPVQRPAGGRARRPGEHGPGAARAQLAVESGADRARRGVSRLVAPDARTVRALVGRDPGHGLHGHVRRAGMRARARLQPCRHARRPAGPAKSARRVRVLAGAQLGGEGCAARGIRARQCAR